MNKKTRLISLALTVLCVISLFSFEIPSVQANPDYEDFTGYTEVDPASAISKTSDTISWVNMNWDSVSYVYDDKGIDHFSGDFTHLVDVYLDSSQNAVLTSVWAVTNEDVGGSYMEGIYVFFYLEGSFLLFLREVYSSTNYQVNMIISIDTWYYLKIERSETDMTCKVYSDSERTNLLDTLSLSLHSVLSCRYIYGLASQDRNYGSARYSSGQVKNLDLQEIENNTPVNDACSITDMDDTNNLYAQISGGYTIFYRGHDNDTYLDIEYILVNITQAATVRVSFKYTNSTDTFSIIDGGSEFTLDGSSSASRAGNNINLTIVFHVQWDATEESDIELKTVITDSFPSSDTDTMQTDYADIVTNLVVSGFACNDDRGDVSQAITFSGTVYYANNPSSSTATTFYPPDAEFSAIHIYDSGDNDEGNDATVVNGAFAVNFNAPASVGMDTYNSYIDMSDADYPDSEENPSDTFITDRIILTGLSSNDTAIPVNEYVEVYVTAKLEYDDHAVGSGDSLTIESLALSWDAGESRFEGSETKASAQIKTYDEGLGNEATYGITVVNMDVFSLTVEWYEVGEGEGYEAGWFGAGLAILILCFSVGGLILFFGLKGKR